MLLLSQTLLLRASIYLPSRNSNSRTFTSKPSFLPPFLPIIPSKPNTKTLKFTTLASVSPSPTIPCKSPQIPTQSFSLALSATIILTKIIQNFTLKTISQNPNALSTIGLLFFASLKDHPSRYLNTPLTVAAAAGLAKWLKIYSAVLIVRVLLSWFPNIPWDQQPLPAIRDLCAPYLNLFRNIIPPIFDTLDVSPLLAFTVLGILGRRLKHSGRMY